MDPEVPEISRPNVAVVYALAILGGAIGILAAVVEEFKLGTLGGQAMVMVLIAPAVEEICKPIGLVFIIDKRPHWLRGRLQIVIMAVLGAAVFATIENALYVHLYHRNAGTGFIVWRYVVCTSMHLAASCVFGLGLARAWTRARQRNVDETGGFDIDDCFRYYVAAVAIHAAYNGAVLLLESTGILRF